MGAVFSPTFAGIAGAISEEQHGAKTGPANAHEMADISGTVSAAQHGSPGADLHHGRTEAKATAVEDTSNVTWTTAFASTPVVVVSAIAPAGVDFGAKVNNASTTGCQVVGITASTGVAVAVAKQVIAQVAT